jgi:hypothetical protein
MHGVPVAPGFLIAWSDTRVMIANDVTKLMLRVAGSEWPKRTSTKAKAQRLGTLSF